MIEDRWLICYARRTHGPLSAARLQMALSRGGRLAGLLRRSIYYDMMKPEARFFPPSEPSMVWWQE